MRIIARENYYEYPSGEWVSITLEDKALFFDLDSDTDRALYDRAVVRRRNHVDKPPVKNFFSRAKRCPMCGIPVEVSEYGSWKRHNVDFYGKHVECYQECLLCGTKQSIDDEEVAHEVRTRS